MGSSLVCWPLFARSAVNRGLSLAIVVCGFLYKQAVNLYAFAGYRPAGAASAMWDDHPGIRESIALAKQEDVYLLTNAPDLLYYRTKEQQHWSLFTQASRGCTPVKIEDQLAVIEEQFAVGREVALVWFEGLDREYLIEPEEYGSYYDVVTSQIWADAAQYRLRSKP
ncbi:MAG: hypothetical protein CL946_08540 [Ectothiorhodospiraceae bacterium]|nr:hypothetical protein [Ectothiorhodospiraceae bacterium]